MGAWVDSHCHLPSLDDPGAALDRARAEGVVEVVTVGTDLASSQAGVGLTAAHPGVAATVGLHPHDAVRLDDEWEALERLAGARGVVGVGETGFDLHYRHSPPADQERAFRAQIGLAGRLGRALVIHTREAWDDTFEILADRGLPERTVFHCFTGGPPEAERALATGALLSISGIVTFNSAGALRDAVSAAPLDRIMVETDAPYLAPVPHRGQRNRPALVARVGAEVAALQDRPVEEVAAATTATAARFYGLDLDVEDLGPRTRPGGDR